MPNTILDEMQAARLWLHEVSRVFHDRLCCQADLEWFYDLMIELLGRHFRGRFDRSELFGPGKNKVIYSDILRLDHNREYEEITDFKHLTKVIDDKLDDYNSDNANQKHLVQMHLVFFNDCIEHILRIARILRLPKVMPC